MLPRILPGALLIAAALAGCTAPSPPSVEDPQPAPRDPFATGIADGPTIAPALGDSFHDYRAILGFQESLAGHPSGIAKAFVLGSSAQGRAIPGLAITAPGDSSGRARVLIDGGIHGNETYGIEAALYVAAWLVENHARNASVRALLLDADVRIIPVLSPDGREANARENANGVDMNRNFDVDFGNPTCRAQALSPALPYYSGPRPLSEPETAALADYMAGFRPQIYLTHHTGRHALIRPWAACDPPSPMPEEDNALFEAIEAWARANTEYQNTGTAEETAPDRVPTGGASGSSSDWCYLTYHCVALTLEVNGFYGPGPDEPVPWSEEIFPITMHVLANAKGYGDWRAPT